MDKLFSLKEFIVKSFLESQNISDKFEELKRDLMIFISGKEEILKSKLEFDTNKDYHPLTLKIGNIGDKKYESRE